MGLRAGTDTSQSAHPLAGRTVHTRSRRRSPPHDGPLTLVRSHAGTSPHGAHPTPYPRAAQAPCISTREQSCACRDPGGLSMREIHDLSFDIDRFLEDAARAKQQLDVERWREELRPRALRLFAARTTKLQWTRALLKLVVRELHPD